MANPEPQSWHDETYAEVYEAACAMVRHRRQSDPAFTPDALRKLLDSAYELMISKGYAATGVSEICSKAGFTQSTEPLISGSNSRIRSIFSRRR